jgi:D-threo-aldose 1-dehydrogenase
MLQQPSGLVETVMQDTQQTRAEVRQLGESQVFVSVLGFGGAPLGGFRSDANEETASETIRAAVDGGITYFDTAPYYGYGRSEHRCGHTLRQLPRDDYVISTKVGRRLVALKPGEVNNDRQKGGLPFRVEFDYSYDGVMRSWEQSVARLGLGKIDLLLIHDVDGKAHFDDCLNGAVKALEELKSCGEIKAFGAGLGQMGWACRFLEETDADCIMITGGYTLLDQSALTKLLPLCQEKGASLLVGGPYNSGILAKGPVPGALYYYQEPSAEILEKTRQIQEIGNKYHIPLPAAALAFPLAHPAVASVVAGSGSPHSVQKNLEFIKMKIPDAYWQDLRRAGLIHEDAPIPGVINGTTQIGGNA